MLVEFNKLKLRIGEVIYLQNAKGEGITGTYQNEFNSSNNTFRFDNHSNGKSELIKIETLQLLKRF
jgi:hypothetical protein